MPKKYFKNLGIILILMIAVISVLNFFNIHPQIFFLNSNAYAASTNCYIDYENGNDANSGLSRDFAWKHHPWDSQATGNSASFTGSCQYYFKKGIIYRGTLTADDSGTEGSPITLGVDPSWGSGEAKIYGSERITSGWVQCANETCPDIPETGRTAVWYQDKNPNYNPMMMYELQGDTVTKLNIARSPNWEVTDPDDPKKNWWEMTGWSSADGITYFEDSNHLVRDADDYWKNGIIWYEDYSFWPRASVITKYSKDSDQVGCVPLRVDQGSNKEYYRYYIEGLPQLLDEANEWLYVDEKLVANAGRIYLRLDGDRNPNTAVIELAQYPHFIKIEGKQNITLNGLSLKFFNGVSFYADASGSPQYRNMVRANNPEYSTSVIRITGNSSNISVLNCDIEYVNQGIGVFPDGEDKLLNNLTFDNNTIKHTEANAINTLLGEGMGGLQWAWSWWPPQQSRIRNIEIINNQIEDIGFRTLSWNPIGAIGLYNAEMLEVANNTVTNTATPGIDVDSPGYWRDTKGYWEGYEGMDYPLQRVLIHNNSVSNACLMTQDMGGIEVWHGGPVYVYNNISGNAVGGMYPEKMQHPDYANYYRTSSFAPAFYSDNGYKNYIFNNIFWGKNNDENDFIYNSVGYYDYDSLMNTMFNNTIYNTAVGIGKGGGMDNRNYYLNNLLINMGERYIEDRTTANSEMGSIAYGYNIFNEHVGSIFGRLELTSLNTYSDFANYLISEDSLSTNPGQEATGNQVVDAENLDFNLNSNSSAVDAGKKVFVPWGLYEAVGEWGFYEHPADVTQILDEHINWNRDFWQRDDVRAGSAPRRDLTAYGVSADDFTEGTLETWVDGVLELNGVNQYCK